MPDFENGWLYESGIGENRAILFRHGELIQVRIERESQGVRAGAIVQGKFREQWVAGRSGIVVLNGGQECLLQPLPQGLTEGALVRVEIVREALNERGGRSKRAKGKPAQDGTEENPGPSLLELLEATGENVRQLHAHEEDILAEMGWHDVMEEAATGRAEFEGGSLLISNTPAMTVVDVDGPLPPVELAKRAAKAIALALVQLDITGNVGVDFPTLEAKPDRAAVAGIFDDHMAADCERTAINGFGFMQIISRKLRPSVLEIVQADRVLSAAIALLRQAERNRGSQALQLQVHPGVAAKLHHRPRWLEQLSKRTGRPVAVESDGKISITGGQVA